MRFGYARVSTKDQVLHGLGLDVQEQFLREAQCSKIFSDKGVSGTLDDRPGLASALAEVQQGDTLLVPRLDRLARDLIVQEQIFRDLQKRGVKIESLAEPDLCSNDPTRVLLRQMLGAIAEYERSLICRRLKGGRVRKHQDGGYAGGAPPYGYNAIDGQLVVNEAEAEVVRLIFGKHKGKDPCSKIASYLNTRGAKTKRGGKWYASTIKAIIANPVYNGLIRYERQERDGKHEAIR